LKKPKKAYNDQLSELDQNDVSVIDSYPSYRSIYSKRPVSSRRGTKDVYFESELPVSNKELASPLSPKRNSHLPQTQS